MGWGKERRRRIYRARREALESGGETNSFTARNAKAGDSSLKEPRD
jgi:hypothetical protein